MTTFAQMAGRVAVVTGGSSGIGAAVAARLEAYGAKVLTVSRSAGASVRLDLAEPGAAGELVRVLDERGVEVEMLVNNAGVSLLGKVADSDPAALRALVDLNAGALTETTALLVPRMVGRGHGTVVNIASTGAYVPAPYMAAYGASKAYVLSFSQALWAETRGSGVRVVAVSPGPTDTPMNRSPMAKRSTGQVVDTVVRAVAGRRPAVVDGGVNRLTSVVFGRVLPGAWSAGLAAWLAPRTVLR
ncbi:SDR family NAD(P)-dependent oxidoreductase [Actinoplanes sp. LDG1-06]|uniref:SDR family NAD(P)-dependent oxidoreductase n=1 Tax=Paractinoplanes ovalisporus TaxID=2810368 RepID=A0ABS2A8I9_9ACTN|nr:SDR family NAD(P)-dependent oxidoreductase [Actinoplanes ovalisporus]MBM2616162.1 SDR family NAD(P)-dependent oxidoreductase [Actinoplanes ovalisporus]